MRREGAVFWILIIGLLDPDPHGQIRIRIQEVKAQK